MAPVNMKGPREAEPGLLIAWAQTKAMLKWKVKWRRQSNSLKTEKSVKGSVKQLCLPFTDSPIPTGLKRPAQPTTDRNRI